MRGFSYPLMNCKGRPAGSVNGGPEMKRTLAGLAILSALALALPSVTASTSTCAGFLCVDTESSQLGQCPDGSYSYSSNSGDLSFDGAGQSYSANVYTYCAHEEHQNGRTSDSRAISAGVVLDPATWSVEGPSIHWASEGHGSAQSCRTDLNAPSRALSFGCPVGAPPAIPALLP